MKRVPALCGMTWDHPRAYRPLQAVEDAAPPGAVRVIWDRQPLAGFEAHPIADLAQRYDLIVVDHPGLGSAVEAGALLPVDEVFDPAELTAWEAASVGPTWRSYHYLDRQWALPIDAATQVGVYRPDLVDAPPPAAWRQVLAYARRNPTALCLGGPHALLTLLAMRAAGAPTGAALALLQDLWMVVDPRVSTLDPIGVHEATRIAYCPLAYGYAGYTEQGVAWTAAPTWSSTVPGSVLGGTGLAVSRRAAGRLDAVRDYVRRLLDDDVQTRLVPEHGGQPAHRGAWDSPGYYRSTRSTVDAAWLRPRGPGWIAFQERASAMIRAALVTGEPAGPLAAELDDEYRRFA
jgi:multiple sugar transport system substrate-binding protein